MRIQLSLEVITHYKWPIRNHSIETVIHPRVTIVFVAFDNLLTTKNKLRPWILSVSSFCLDFFLCFDLDFCLCINFGFDLCSSFGFCLCFDFNTSKITIVLQFWLWPLLLWLTAVLQLWLWLLLQILIIMYAYFRFDFDLGLYFSFWLWFLLQMWLLFHFKKWWASWARHRISWTLTGTWREGSLRGFFTIQER